MSGASGTVVPTVSWPGLARPPTPLPPPAPPVVGGRHKAGHDTMGDTSPLFYTMGTPPRYFDAYAGAAPQRVDSAAGVYGTDAATSVRPDASNSLLNARSWGPRPTRTRPSPSSMTVVGSGPVTASPLRRGGCTRTKGAAARWSA